MSTLQEVMTSKDKGPYEKSIRAKVVCAGQPVTYQNAQKETRHSMTAAIADNTMAVKLVCYDPAKFARLTAGTTLMVRNFIRRDGTVVLTKTSKLFPTQAIIVPESISCQGDALVNPPAAPLVALRQALSSPPKVKVSVSGKIVQDEEEREVMVRDVPTKIRTIFIQDSSMDRVKVALWRNTCPEVRTGNHIHVSDVVVNNYRNESSLNTTFSSTVTKMEQPTVEMTIQVIGASVEGDTTELLLDDDTVRVVSTPMIDEALPGEQSSEMFFIENGCTPMKVQQKGTAICAIELLA